MSIGVGSSGNVVAEDEASSARSHEGQLTLPPQQLDARGPHAAGRAVIATTYAGRGIGTVVSEEMRLRFPYLPQVHFHPFAVVELQDVFHPLGYRESFDGCVFIPGPADRPVEPPRS